MSFGISVALIFFGLEDMSIDWIEVLNVSYYVFSSTCPVSVSVCFIYWGIDVDKCNILFFNWSFYHFIVSFFIFLNGLCFNVYFVWYDSVTSSFLSFPLGFLIGWQFRRVPRASNDPYRERIFNNLRSGSTSHSSQIFSSSFTITLLLAAASKRSIAVNHTG